MLRRPTSNAAGWPQEFGPIEAQLEWPSLSDIDAGKLSLLGHARRLGAPADWAQREAEDLWRFHLHYWDWAWGLVQDESPPHARAVYERLWLSWMEQVPFGRFPEWSPYVASLRAWSWCGQYESLVSGGDLAENFIAALHLHAGYLRAHLELDVGGNHLVKNLKALIGLSVFLRDDVLLRRSLRRLERQLQRQMLADGGHFERAPAYHCQVLGDLIDIAGVIKTPPEWLSEAVHRMRRWLGLVLLPDGAVPLLNDGYPVSPRLLEALAPGPPAPYGLTLLEKTGLAVLRRGDLFVLADVGLPCPDGLPAHAHADTLGFLFYAGSTRLVGECWTSTYTAGAVRDFERSTAAHSTVEVDDANSTEVWNAFRAARRARPAVLTAEDDKDMSVLAASHNGYTRLPGKPVHTRVWRLTSESLEVVDRVDGTGHHQIALRFHGTPMSAVHDSSHALVERVTRAAIGWSRREDAVVLERSCSARLPWRFRVTMALDRRR